MNVSISIWKQNQIKQIMQHINGPTKQNNSSNAIILCVKLPYTESDCWPFLVRIVYCDWQQIFKGLRQYFFPPPAPAI